MSAANTPADNIAMGILEKINSPADLKRLAGDELQQLADELRAFIIANVSESGGHLAPSLGALEIIVALHYIFDSPWDRIIYDTGHQAYAHKIICGRRDSFTSLRKYGGIGGFIRPEESEHDIFEVGHASTSIAAAMGFARAAELKGEDRHTIALIGDGAMTGGLALAAMNNSEIGTGKLIVILNDNGMSIAPNVGKISRVLSNLRQRTDMRLLNRLIADVVKLIPVGGKTLEEAWTKLKQSLLYFVSPYASKAVFDSWGMKYFGPYDGHDLKNLVRVFKKIKGVEGPALVHLLTVKGKGYVPAEKQPTVWHGVGKFNKVAGKIEKKSSVKSYTEIFAETLIDLAHEDKRIVAITAAMPQGTGLDKFQQQFPSRFFDVGIAEDFAVTFAAGLAKSGMRPVAAIYSTFLQRAFDQVIHDVGIQNIPVVFALDRAGLVGEDGATHHGYFDLSYLNLIPNYTIAAPCDEDELRHMLHTAILHETGPISIRYPRGSALGVPLSDKLEKLRIGSWSEKRKGDAACVIAIGAMVGASLEAAEKLSAKGIELEVVNARFLKPMDEDFLAKIHGKFRHVITVEENVKKGGLGDAVLGWMTDRAGKPPRILKIGLPDRFVLHGNQNVLRKELGLDPCGMEASIEAWLKTQTEIKHYEVI